MQGAALQRATAGATPAVDATLLLEGRPHRVRRVSHTKIPWLLFVMAFGIAFGIGQDRQLRRELGSKLRATSAQAAAIVARRVSAAF